MAPITIAPEAAPAATLFRPNDDFLRAAVLAVLAPWKKRTGPDATFRFLVQITDAGNTFTLLHQENSGTHEPFVLARFELRNGKIWLMRNETETDFGAELVRWGVPHDVIVPGLLPPDARKDSGYATE